LLELEKRDWGRHAMSNYTHETAPTQIVEADGIRYAYRRFGKAGTVPRFESWGPQYQHAGTFLRHVNLFLSEENSQLADPASAPVKSSAAFSK